MDRDRQTAILNCEISAVWEMKTRAYQKTSGLLMGPVQELKPRKLYDDDDDDDDDEIEQLLAMCDSKSSSYRNKQVAQYGGIVQDIY